MKKSLIIIIALILLISSFDIFAGCTGTCTSCSIYSSQSTCTLQSGCSWTPQSCSGTPKSCSTYTTQATCQACSCNWNPGQQRCSGTPTCGSYASQGTCNTCGCAWTSQACYGSCTACSSYSTESSCRAQGGCSWSDTCGDGVCAGSEDCSCSDCDGKQDGCPTNYFCSGGGCTYSGAGGTCAEAGGTCKPNDCGTYIGCSAESGGSCDAGYCCTGSCTTPFSACGNGECESGETCLNCEIDCGTCIEDAITLAFREPLDGDTLKRGTYILKVIVFFGKNPTSSAKVTAESTLFDEKIKLYDDSAHKDEKQFDGIYANEFTIKKDTKPGGYRIKVKAEKEQSSNEQTIKIIVDPNLKIKLSGTQEIYVKGERLQLKGLVEDFEDATPNVTIGLSLDRLGDVLYNQTYKTNIFGQFFDSYLISFADPDGEWILKLNAEDKDGNEGSLELKPRIGTPEGVAYYLLEFLSPIKGSSYSRGETVPISIEVSEEEKPVKEAEVTFLSPKGKYLELTELEPGVYTTNYNIPFDDPLGQWRLAVQAIKITNEVTRAGGNVIPLQIKTGEIRFEILSPLEEKALTGTELIYKIKVTYPNDSPVQGANLKAELSNNQTIQFLEEKPGIYVAKYFICPKDVGSLDAKIIANDNKGNTATLPSILLYVKERTIIELGIILLYQNLIRPYWWAILTFLIIAGMLYKPTFDIKMLKMSIRNAKQEQKTVKAMQMEAEREYYKRKTINKTDFRRLIQQYKERLAKSREQQNIAEEKLKKKLEVKKPKEK